MKHRMTQWVFQTILVLALLTSGTRAETAPAQAARPLVKIGSVAGPWVNLSGGRALPLSAASAVTLTGEQARPLTLTAADFDSDGAPDIVAGYATAAGGLLALYGDITGGAAQTFALPIAPDFLGVGDFNADGFQDVVAAARGGDALWFLPGDGAGGFGAMETVGLPGALTALAVGEIGRQDGLADLAVGVTTAEGARLLILTGESGAQAASPEVYPLPAPLTAVVIGQLDDAYPFDLAIAAGKELFILRGYDQFALEKSAPVLETFPLEFTPVSLALGDFLSGDDQALEIALLAENGQIHLFDRRGAAIGDLSSVVGGGGTLLRAKTSSLPSDDLLLVDAASRQVHILTADGQRMTPEGVYEQAAAPGALATLDAAAFIIAALPVRLNGDALDDLVLLAEGAPAPTAILTAAVHTFTVTSPGDQNDDNPGNGKCESTLLGGKVCTLRGAIQEANASSGADEIQINIRRGYWSTDSIRPGTLLPNITEAVKIIDIWPGEKQVIDGSNTPAGIGLHILSGNTTLEDLAFVAFVNTTTDNPVIKISSGEGNLIRDCQIGPSNGGTGVEFASGNNRIENSVVSGNNKGISISGGSGNVIGPANYIGFGPDGTGATNNWGIQVTGGTYAQIGTISGAPNVISGNRSDGILLKDTATSGTLIIGNTIGLNTARTQGLGNGFSGIKIITGAAATTIGNNTTAGRNLIGDNTTGIKIDHSYVSPDTIIRGNYIGVNADASAAIANKSVGIHVNTLSIVQVRNNVIGGAPSSDDGVKIEYGATQPRAHPISDNIIGTNAGGEVNLGHGKNGVTIVNIRGVQMTNNTIQYSGQDGIFTHNGGQSTISNNNIFDNGRYGMNLAGNSYTLAGNVVGFNGHTGILVSGGSNTLSNNRVINNTQVGINIQGPNNTVSNSSDAYIGGGSYGVILDGAYNNTISGYTIRNASTGILVRGTNHIIGPSNRIYNNFTGIDIAGAATGTSVRGNTLGVDATGNVAAPNYEVGILNGGTNTTIGGSSAADGNVISGGGSYLADGLRIWGGSGTTVRNNKIGVGLNGTTPLGNLTGIHIIGGTQSSIQDNLIAYNGTGVLIEQGARHAIVGNSIHSNTTLGIDLSPAGVTLNDTGDGDTGANDLQNFPVITLAGIVGGSSTRAVGMLDSAPSRTFTIRLYSSPTCDDSGHGEGQTYLGQGTVTTNAGGQANIDLTVGTAATLGHRLTATATDPDGNTSEFSACSAPLGILGADTFTVNTLGDVVDNNTSDGICDSSAAAGEQCTLRAAIQQANANTGLQTILLPAGTYPLTLAGFDNVAAVGDLDIIGDLILSGAGANAAIVQGEMTDRVFEIRSSATVTISGVTVRGGNIATTANGAGFLVNSGTTLTLEAVSVQENQTASGSGGGIYSAGTLTLSNSAVISNTAGGETNGGGGVFVLSGVTTLRNTTVSGNQSRGNGGGIQNLAGTVRLNNVTVAYNTADSDNDGGDGGGLYNLHIFEVKNSIAADNVDLSPGGYPYGQADCSGAFTTQGYNLIGDRARASDYPTTPDGCTGFGGAGNFDSVGGGWMQGGIIYLRYTAGLGPLQLNGGATPNHSPLASTSVWVVDRGNPAAPGSGGNACEPFDQRDQPRPIDGGTDGVAVCDRGAVELIPSYLSIGDATVAEGSTANFAVSLSAPAQITFTVQYSTTNITAVAGQDYTHVAGTLTFTPGQTTRTISVPTLTDTYNEDTETFRVRLYWPSYVLIADGEGIGSITDGSPQPALLINDRTVTEGDAGSSAQAVFAVTLNSPSGKTVTVDYATVDDTAVAGEDYAAAQGQLIFAPGSTTQNIAVTVIGDDLREGNETFTVQLSNPVNATLGDATGQGAINDDDTPAFSIYDASILEGDSGTSAMGFIVELSKPSTQAVTVKYTTSPGTATAGSDYVHTSGTLTFAAGETVKSLSVTINGDEDLEPHEIFTVALNTPTGGAIIARGTATGTILDDDRTYFYVFLPLVIRN